jgi:hypothetical protein
MRRRYRMVGNTLPSSCVVPNQNLYINSENNIETLSQVLIFDLLSMLGTLCFLMVYYGSHVGRNIFSLTKEILIIYINVLMKCGMLNNENVPVAIDTGHNNILLNVNR